VNLLARTSLALSLTSSLLSTAALLGCSGAESEGDGDIPRFQATPPGASNGGPGGAPAANPNNNPPTTSPTPNGEQPPVTGGIDMSGASPTTMLGGASGAPSTPTDPNAPAPGTPDQPVAPVGGGSAGCGTAAVPAADAVANTLLNFPPGYDGSTPTPLLFGFHGAGRTNLEQRMVDSRTVGSELENNYIVAYMKSAGNAWDLNTDYPRFEAALQQIEAIACVDTSALFAFGHSSGAQFIVQMLGNPNTRETRFAAIAPVSSSDYGNPAWSPVPTLLIHGLNDTARPGDNNGAQDISQYAESNQCSGGTAPLAVPSCASLAGGVAVNAGCVQYNGCAAPTLFCNHNDPNYLDNGNPTNHGWPCFANSQIFQFFESQR
jgi:polyhydroxybutyrate depolymerase